MRFQVGKRSEEVHCIVLFLKERQKEGCPQEPNILSLIGWLSKLHWFQICQKKNPFKSSWMIIPASLVLRKLGSIWLKFQWVSQPILMNCPNTNNSIWTSCHDITIVQEFGIPNTTRMLYGLNTNSIWNMTWLPGRHFNLKQYRTHYIARTKI